jgi:hypothetical protein
MSTIRVVNIQHPDSVDPNVILNLDGTVTISGLDTISVSGTAQFASGTAANPEITFIDDTDTGIYSPAANEVAITTSGTERLKVDDTGNVGIGTSSPAVALDVSGEVRASTGVLFGTDTAAANTLDDYEEGTWVPQVAGSTTAGTASYNYQDGSYEKIGRQVTLRGFVDWSSLTGTGSLEIRGLPFPSFAGTFDYIQTGSIMLNSIVFNAGYTMATAYMANGSTAMNVFLSGNNVGYLAKTVEAAGAIIFSITYTTSA